MVQTVVTSKHEDCNLVFTNHGKEDGIYPLKRVSKAQDKDQRSIVTTCKNTYRSGGAREVPLKVVFVILKYYL